MIARPSQPPKTSPAWCALAALDRDGTLNACVEDPDSGLAESPLFVEDVRLLPGVAAPLERLAAAGYALVCASNQPAAAKRKTTVAELLAIHERVLDLLGELGVQLQLSLLCLHHPDGAVPELSRRCGCRKGAPGMLLRAYEELGLTPVGSWMIGDTDADVDAGQAAGCSTVLLEYPPSAHKRSGDSTTDLLADGLSEAVSQVLDRAAG